MAEAIFRARLQKSGEKWQTWKIGSAGTWAADGQAASVFAVKTMSARGMDISEHKARSISKDLISENNLVLTMEMGQREALVAEFPEFEKRIHLLSEMSGVKTDVRDPYGGDLEEYQYGADVLDGLITKGLTRIIFLARKE